MASKTDICNQALSHLAHGKTIANLDSEKSEEAAACRTFFDTALDELLRDFPWPFATKIANLNKVSDSPNDEWDFSYRYPSDALQLRRILSGVRNDNRQSRVPFKISSDSQGLLIFSDERNAQLEYTSRFTDVVRFPADFRMALSFLIAAYIAPRITGGDRSGMGARALQMYEFWKSKAEAASANEEQPDEERESEFITARGAGAVVDDPPRIAPF